MFQKRRMSQLTSVMQCPVFWISYESGTDRLSQNIGKELQLHAAQYLRRMQISQDDLAMQALVWLQFKAIWFRAVQFCPSYANLRQPHIFKHQV